MGEVIVVTSGKGGVGKTTTVANLGTGLAMLGAKVVMVDADIGLRNLDVIMGLENRIVYDLVDIIQGRCRLKQGLIKDKRFNESLFLLPAAQSKDKTAVNAEEMTELCDRLKEEFEYVLVDSPAGIEQGFQNAIAGADRALVVTTAEVSAVRDADRIIGLLEAAGKNDPELIVNRIRNRMVKQGDMMDIDDMIDILAIKLLGIVPDDDSIVVSSNKGEPAVLTNQSRAGTAFHNISRRLLGEEVPLMSMEEDQGLWSRLRNLFGRTAQ